MMYNAFIAIGVVAILLILFAEYRYQKKNRVQLFQMADSITNAACGLSDRVFTIFLDTFQFVVWSKMYHTVAFIQIPSTVYTWLICLIIVDFIWYWYHRLGHEVRLFWAIHSLHHQSEEFNISVGFRISILQSMLRGVFWLILPILGFHPDLLLTVLVFHGLYQLPLHTRLAPRLGILEYIFVTPSAHRVHHGINAQYLDKNFGGIFIFWDRMFGTYAVEKEEVIYGITDQTGNLSFLAAHLYGFRQLIVPKHFNLEWREKWRYLFSKPSFVPPGASQGFKPRIKQFEIKNELIKYVVWQIVLASWITFFFILHRNQLSLDIKSALVFFIGWTLISATLHYDRIHLLLLVHESIRLAGIIGLIGFMAYQHFIPWYFIVPVGMSILLSFLYLPIKSISVREANSN